MYVPFRIFASSRYNKKLDKKNLEQTIFEDKIVNKKSEPTLYNIEAGLAAVKTNTAHSLSIKERRKGKRSGLPQTRSADARELLTLINVQPAQLPRRFSLLSAQTDRDVILNPNIFYKGDYSNIPAGVSVIFDSAELSANIVEYGFAPLTPGFGAGPLNPTLTDGVEQAFPSPSTTDKFKVAGDTFYLLDESADIRKTEEIQEPIYKQVRQPDLSHIAANFTILNNSPDYFGKNKYYK